MPKLRSKLWIKGSLLILAIVLLCSLSIAIYCIPLTWDYTYRMEKKAANLLLDQVLRLVKAKHNEIEGYKKFALEMKERELQDITSIVYGYLDEEYRSYNKTDPNEEREVQNRVIRNVRNMKYGINDYVFISDFDSVLICHPDDNLQGKDYSGVRDVRGDLIVPRIVAAALTGKNGFSTYWWPRLGMKEPSEKLTFGKVFLPWNWVIGTGVYLDDIADEIDMMKSYLLVQLRQMMRQIVFGKTGYMFVFDSNMKMIVNPNSSLEGTNFESVQNPLTGKSLARELEAAAHQENNEVAYRWDRPTDQRNYVYDKIAWVRYFKGFDWYIGASVYTEELHENSKLLAKRILVCSILSFVGALLLGSFFLRRLLQPIEHLSRVALRVQQGDLEARSGIRRGDEIGILASEFDAMVDELKDNVEKLDAKVREKTRELHENYNKLNDANQRIVDSIEYAETIQQGILPTGESMARHLKEHFVIWEPKDIIGGDFYWFSSQEDGALIAVADCTGHGVPGAIMTMIAGMALQQVAKELDTTDPSLILRTLNRMVQSVLNQDTSEGRSNDELDIGICHVSLERGSVRFAGARIDLYYILEGELMFLKGDKQSLGYKSSDIRYPYFLQEIRLESDMRFYMTTDGLLDQAGGPQGFPFGKRRFREFLMVHHREPLEMQRAALKREIGEYRGSLERRDDITVLGFVPA